MILLKKAADLHKWHEAQQKKDATIGFVPTMGALHAGHISLILSAKKKDSTVVCSLFVNPTQFNDPKDFEKYPLTLEKDISLLLDAGCDILFLPGVREIYPEGVKTSLHYELGYLETVLEGKFRPGHFQGVSMVMHRLLEIVQPDNLYIGQKDYQQCMVITKLVESIKKHRKLQVIICPTQRETDGLAMSSRNMRLQGDEREKAPTIYRSLQFIKENIQPGDLSATKQKARDLLEKAGFKVDYVEIADAATLSLVDHWDGKQKLVALIAAFLHEVRLIDNMLLH